MLFCLRGRASLDRRRLVGGLDGVGICRGRLCSLRVGGVEDMVCLRHHGVQAIRRVRAFFHVQGVRRRRAIPHVWDDHHRAISRADLRCIRANRRAVDIHHHHASLCVFPSLYVHPERCPTGPSQHLTWTNGHWQLESRILSPQGYPHRGSQRPKPL